LIVPTDAIADANASIRPLTRGRMNWAIVVAVVADVLQVLVGPFGFTFFDEIVDVVAALIIWRLIGFHWMLLPTVGLEFIPLVDLLPTWTGCVLWVIRKRKQEIDSLKIKRTN
jgi:hypothetical protein